MNRQIALAYGVAGLAVAIAFVTVVATTVGFSDAAAPPESAAASPIASVDPAALADFPSQRNAAEVVYVDEMGNPVDERVAQASGRARGDDDDRWEHEEDEDDHDEHHGRRHHDDD